MCNHITGLSEISKPIFETDNLKPYIKFDFCPFCGAQLGRKSSVEKRRGLHYKKLLLTIADATHMRVHIENEIAAIDKSIR